MGGFNNNPTMAQFISAYKKLLLQLKASATGNCLPLSEITILSVNNMITPMEAINCSRNEEMPESARKISVDDMESCILSEIDSESEYVVPYMAGFVTKKLLSTMKCEKCIEAILDVQSSYVIQIANMHSYN